MRLLAKYQPKMSPNVRTIYGRAAIGCCSHIGSPWGRRNPIAMRKISPPGKRTARSDFQSRLSIARTCVLWTMTRDAREMRERRDVDRLGSTSFGASRSSRLSRAAILKECFPVAPHVRTLEVLACKRGFQHRARGGARSIPAGPSLGNGLQETMRQRSSKIVDFPGKIRCPQTAL